MAPQSRYYNDGVALTPNTFTYKSHIFDGWDDINNIKTYPDKYVGNLTEENDIVITLKARWKPVAMSCKPGYNTGADGNSCQADVISCELDNALIAEQKWNFAHQKYDDCYAVECDDGYHLSQQKCVENEQECYIENGEGKQTWNDKTMSWNDCEATSCDAGYTSDASETNETWKQCGRCNNAYAENGNLAASSYLSGCEIATCMYQGEKYILENNECVLICDERSDETGSRYWNGNTCVHECKPGFLTW
jgi:hypothetical protein